MPEAFSLNLFKPPIRRRGPFFYADQALALGPPSIGSQEANTLPELFGTPWTLQFTKAPGAVGLRFWDGSNWQPRGFYEVADNAQHLALAFDQSARPVIAWEASQEFSTVLYWDEAARTYQTRAFSGVNPVLINDALAHYRLSDSDVVLFYLSEDRTRVLARIQRERYDTEHEVAVLDEPAYLDQVVPLPYQLGLLLSREAESVALTSELYPYRSSLSHKASVSGLQGGLYKTNLVLYEGGDGLSSSLSALRGGSYDENLQQYASSDAHSAALTALRGGSYDENRVSGGGAQAQNAQLSALRGGAYEQKVLPYNRDPDSVSGSVGALRGGSYDPI